MTGVDHRLLASTGHRLLRSNPRRAVGINHHLVAAAEAEFGGALNAGVHTSITPPWLRRLRPAAARVRGRRRRHGTGDRAVGASPRALVFFFFFAVHTSSRGLPRRVLREPERASKPRASTTRRITQRGSGELAGRRRKTRAGSRGSGLSFPVALAGPVRRWGQ